MMRDPGWIRNVWPSNINVSDVAVNVPLDLYISKGSDEAWGSAVGTSCLPTRTLPLPHAG